MTHLVLVGDCAFPLSFDSGDPYPSDMVAVCGYLGGNTPHVWTDDEIVAVRRSGRQFWPIWTAPNGPTGVIINAAIGARDGQRMVTELTNHGIPKDVPVFYDVESSTYNASPNGAIAAIQQFKAALKSAGWEAYAYCTKAFGRDWVAWWTNMRPTSLPDSWIGQQYSGRPGLDFSVFDLDKLGVTVLSQDDVSAIAVATRNAIATWMQQYMQDKLGGSIQRLVQLLGIATSEQADIATIKAALTSAGQPGSPVDVHAVSEELDRLLRLALTGAADALPPATTAP